MSPAALGENLQDTSQAPEAAKLEKPMRAFLAFLREIAAIDHTSIFGQIGEGMTLATMWGLDKLFRGHEVPPWVKVIIEGKGKGAGGYRGCYSLNSELNLSNPNLFWLRQFDGDRYYLIKDMVHQLVFEVEKYGDWLEKNPGLNKNADWEVREPRDAAIVRLVFGKPPTICFADLPLDYLKKYIDAPDFLAQIINGEVPPQLKHLVIPVAKWFEENGSVVPCVTLRITEDKQGELPQDPRQSIFTLEVCNPAEPVNPEDPVLPILPKFLGGQIAHLLIDGSAVKKRLTNIWKAVIGNKQSGYRPPGMENVKAPPTKREEGHEHELVANPFLDIAFNSQGCKEIATALEIDTIISREIISEADMGLILDAAKKLGIKVTSAFMAALSGKVKTSPVAPVTPDQEFSINKKTRLRQNTRAEFVTFGHALYFQSEQFQRLVAWATEPNQTVSLPEFFLHEKLFKATPFGPEFIKHAQLYQKQIEFAKASFGMVTYFAALTGKQRPNIEKITTKVATHLMACMIPAAQFSSLGAVPDVGEDLIEWDFVSAGSETVPIAVSLLGNELTTKMFLDNPTFLFEVLEEFIQNNNLFPESLLLLKHKAIDPNHAAELANWLGHLDDNRQAQKAPPNKPGVIAMEDVPVVIAGIKYVNIQAAIHEAGRDAQKMADVFNFLNTFLLQVSQSLSQPTAVNLEYRQQIRKIARQKAKKFSQDMVSITKAILLTTLLQTGHENDDVTLELAKSLQPHQPETKTEAAQFLEMATATQPTLSVAT